MQHVEITYFTMDASEWLYIGEGGKHAIFSYRGDEKEWNGRVLRIPKDVLSAAPNHHYASNVYVYPNIHTDGTDVYMENVVKPLMKQYIDIPKVIQLEYKFLTELRDRTLSEGVIAQSRRDDWTRSPSEACSIPKTPPVAKLLWNYREMKMDSCVGSICMELKPKAGYTACSPLVHPSRRIKYRKTRFEILQQLHCNGFISKGWSDDTPRVRSLYNPLDLFSGNVKTVKKALDDLVTTPQNNLRICMGDGFLLAHDKTEDNALYNKALGLISCIDESQTDSQAKDEFFDLVTTLASQILVQEKILEKLHSLQRLDIIDADGAILIYERLRELCGDQADDLLDSAFSLQESTLKEEDNGQGSDVNKSPFKQPSDSSVLSVLLQEIESFSRKLHDCLFQVKCDEMDEALERCTRLVDSLTQNACIYLLQNWLLSLVMCDVSIFLTVQTICSSREELKKLGGRSVLAPGAVKENNNDNSRVVRRQSESSPGILLASNNRAFAYTLKIVDCDRKPASKLRSRVEKEEPIRFYDNDER